MTVIELIEILKQHPQNMRVVIRGYEGGVDDIEFFTEEGINVNVNTSWYYGKHELLSESYDKKYDEVALLIS